MSIAKAPGQQLLMTAFMLWMSGNSLQIFSIMMLSMALWKPISEMLNVQTRFARFADSGVDMTLPKITFIALHLAGLALGLYKCNTMGLLPTSTADWVDSSLRTVRCAFTPYARADSFAHPRHAISRHFCQTTDHALIAARCVVSRAVSLFFFRNQAVQVSGGGVV